MRANDLFPSAIPPVHRAAVCRQVLVRLQVRHDFGIDVYHFTRCRSVLPSAGGPVLTGGSDKCLRFWNARQPEASYIIAGPPSTDPSTSMVGHVAIDCLLLGVDRLTTDSTYADSRDLHMQA